MTKNETLYIIGNGFDMHHGMDTSYLSFAKYLQKKHPNIYDLFLEHFGLPDIKPDTKWDAQWAKFEEVLGQIYADELLDKYAEYAANPGANDFSDKDWDTTATLIEQEIDKLLKGMNTAFNRINN